MSVLNNKVLGFQKNTESQIQWLPRNGLLLVGMFLSVCLIWLEWLWNTGEPKWDMKHINVRIHECIAVCPFIFPYLFVPYASSFFPFPRFVPCLYISQNIWNSSLKHPIVNFTQSQKFSLLHERTLLPLPATIKSIAIWIVNCLTLHGILEI